jgi:hypothetical protein
MLWNLKLIGAALIATPILLAGSAWFGFNKGKESGMRQVQTLWDWEKTVQTAAQAEEQMKARQREQALQATINRVRQEKQREATRLAADYAAVINSLHDRPEARSESAGGVPEGSVAGTKPATGCTGAQLSGPDSRFLAGEAARADQLRIALAACIAHADAVERELNGTPRVE